MKDLIERVSLVLGTDLYLVTVRDENDMMWVSVNDACDTLGISSVHHIRNLKSTSFNSKERIFRREDESFVLNTALESSQFMLWVQGLTGRGLSNDALKFMHLFQDAVVVTLDLKAINYRRDAIKKLQTLKDRHPELRSLMGEDCSKVMRIISEAVLGVTPKELDDAEELAPREFMLENEMYSEIHEYYAMVMSAEMGYRAYQRQDTLPNLIMKMF